MRKFFTKTCIALLMALFLFPVGAKAQEAYAVENGEELTFYYDNNSSSRSGTIYSMPTGLTENPGWQDNGNIKKAVFDASFIGYKPIGLFHWFYGCYKLESIEGIEYLNTEDVEITNFMFYNCKYLTSLDLSTFDTSKVSYMVSMFEGCERLTTLNISGFDTSNVTTMRSMFCYCYKLASIDVSGFDTSKVNDMYRMFYHCKFLTSLDLTKFDTSNVSEMRYMFCNCYNLTTIYCNDTWSCGRSNDMFNGCLMLQGAVAYDANKTDVKMANPDTGYFTGETTPIITTVAPYAVSNEGTLTFYYDDQREQRSGTIYAVPDDDDIVPNWCNSEEKDTKYVFDASFKDYTPTTINKWFRENKVLATIEGLEYLNTSAVTDMSELFWWCHALTSLDLSSFDTSKVTDMSKMFYYCISLTSLDLTKFDTSNVTNMDYMFCGSNKLTTIYCNDTWSCGRSNDMFNGCLMLQGAVAYDANKTDVKMANPDTGYFTKIDASVSDINADESLTPPVIYNLQGIKMQTPQNSLPSGIYIVNGKKVLLRQ